MFVIFNIFVFVINIYSCKNNFPLDLVIDKPVVNYSEKVSRPLPVVLTLIAPPHDQIQAPMSFSVKKDDLMPTISPPQPAILPPPEPINDLPVLSGPIPIHSLCGNGRLDRVVNRIACPILTPSPLFVEVEGLSPCVGFVYIEQCDDANTFDNDGCSSVCMKECCGNGIVEEGEECDMGRDKGPNLPNISPPNNIPIQPGEAATANANDRFFVPYAACSDPARVVDEENCSRHCQLIICGDGIVNGLEQCDDANDRACDGCFKCALETPTVNNCCNCTAPST
jgi:cysteine-rich repeat protein